MPIEVLMPALSPTMTEGNLVKWLKKEGEDIVSGDVIAEIETDKATMEVETVDEGKLARILIPEGTENVRVNQVIALILEEDEDASVLEGYSPKEVAVPTSESSAANDQAQQASPKASPSQSAAAAPALQPAPTPAPMSAPAERIFASPVAKRLAEQNGINLANLQGSGPKNRIVKADVEAALQSGGVVTAPTPQLGVAGPAYQDIPVSSMRKVIAERLSQSKREVPHFYLSVDCNLDRLMAVRKDLNASLAEAGIKISVNDFVIKACAAALQKVPEANASWEGSAIRQYASSDISVAVAIEGGLITPIVKAAHLKSLSQISQEMKDLAKRAREGKLKPEEFQGGSFSLSNLGMYGIKSFSAVINPPQGAILAVGAGEKQAVVKDDGQITSATIMNCTLSVDHRAIDGAVGADLLTAIKAYIENPMLMLA